MYVTDYHTSLTWYFINRTPIKLIVDGVSASQAIITPNSATSFLDMREYLTSHTAEDIMGIEIMHSTRYANAYLSRYDPGDLLIDAFDFNPPVNIIPSDIAFVEITTRSGHGPIITNTPGMYLYKPLPIIWPKQFYKPKYSVKDTVKHLPYLRSTIDWEPDIMTDANGEGKVWFYTADKPTTYTITIEGTDMNGLLGYKRERITIIRSKEKTK